MTEASPYEAIAAIFEQVKGLDASLNYRLQLLFEAVLDAAPQYARAVDRLISRLQSAGVGGTAPEVGEPMPDFLLPDQDGRLVGLEALLAKGPAIISVHRGHWCPYCRLTAMAYAGVQDVVGPEHMVAITPETRAFNRVFGERTGAKFRVLTDIDNAYALSMGLAFWVDDEFADLMRSVGQDLAAYQAGAAWILPVPSTFVVDAGGVVRAKHVDPNYRRRIEVEDLLAAYQAIA